MAARCIMDWDAHLNKLQEHGQHEQPYAVTTEASLEHLRTKWRLFCDEILHTKDSDGRLREARPDQLKAFFDWLIQNAKKPQQAPTLRQYLRLLKMVYQQLTRQPLDEAVGRDIDNYIRFFATGKKHTVHRPKPVASGADFIDMIHFLYAKDKTKYPDERQRVQQAFLMIVHASSGLRPSSTMRSNKTQKLSSDSKSGDLNTSSSGSKEAEEGALCRLRYRDLALLLTRDEHGRMRFVVRASFSHFKGDTRRSQKKQFVWFDEADVLTCPATHLIALAIYDDAFESNYLHSAEAVLDRQVPPNQGFLHLRWRQAVQDDAVFRANSSPRQELSVSVAATRLKKLGAQMGYRESLTWYCLRRLVLNAVDGVGSEEARNQIAGHLDSAVYRAAYQDQNINIDVAATVRRREPEDFMLRTLNTMGINADPKANVSLTEDDLERVNQLPDVLRLKADYQRMSEGVRQTFGTLKDAPHDHALVRQCTTAQKQYRARKSKHQVALQSRRRREYFARKDTALIEAQVTGGDCSELVGSRDDAFTQPFPERAALADLAKDKRDFRQPEMRCRRILAVQAMTDLCGRVELKRKTEHSGSVPRPSKPRVSAAVSPTEERFPFRCQPLQCIFCMGDERLVYEDRMRHFSRLQALWRHVRQAHLPRIPSGIDVQCPHPLCQEAKFMAADAQHLKNHVQRDHGIRLLKA